jgi:predicted RNA-binding protein with TRAM domain
LAGRAFEEREHHKRSSHNYIIEKPVKAGEEYDVSISGVGTRGDAFARINNFVVFVPGASEGDNLRIRITNVREKFATAEIVGASAAGAKGPAAEEEAKAEEPEGDGL